ncbi:MAG: adenylate kinase [Thermomicrobiales bacterium]|jgi:adenylate kinase|nr:adenylate kinase [Thermomicrobiales bacterium]
MYIVLIGPQGSGKGTQADRLVASLGVMKISTGELFRAERAAGTELGNLVAGILDAGELVPDDVTIAIVEERLKQIDAGAASGAVFDGFPRNLSQAEALDAALAGRNAAIEHVVSIDISEEKLIDRLSGRRVCSSCGAVYHIDHSPPANDAICDRCGGSVVQRADDTPEAIQRRLAIFAKATKPLLDYYGERGIVSHVDGDQAMEAVEESILNVLQERAV